MTPVWMSYSWVEFVELGLCGASGILIGVGISDYLIPAIWRMWRKG